MLLNNNFLLLVMRRVFVFTSQRFLKVLVVDKRNNTFQNLHGVINKYHRDSIGLSSFGLPCRQENHGHQITT